LDGQVSGNVVSLPEMSIVLRGLAVLGFVLALSASFARTAAAQTWQWQVVVHYPDRAPMNSRSQVVLTNRDVVMNYSAHVGQTDIPITSCRAQLGDIANVRALQNAGHAFLFVALKPSRPAACASGTGPIALVPIIDDSAANDAVAAISRACCRQTGAPATAPRAPAVASAPKVVTVATAPKVVAVATAPKVVTVATAPKVVAVATAPKAVTVAGAPKASAPPVLGPFPPPAAPAPRPSLGPPPASLRVTDWIENEGLFAFVRVRNRGNTPVTITAGQVNDCRNVISGCGPFPSRARSLAPGTVATFATIMSGDPGNTATFSYRYDARSGAAAATGNGLSAKRIRYGDTPMSPREIRAGEAVGVAALRPRGAAPLPPAFVNARLTRRGTSRLAIGQSGLARVRVNVSSNGVPQGASIVSISNRALIAAALELAVSSSYAPAMRDGRPVDADYLATFQFDGADPALSSVPVWRRTANAPASPAPAQNSKPNPAPSPKPNPTPSPKPNPSPVPSASPNLSASSGASAAPAPKPS
jgi:hypothetical protein